MAWHWKKAVVVKGGPVMWRSPLWGLVVLSLAAGGGLAAWTWLGPTLGLMPSADQTEGALEKLEVYGRVPDFSLIERSGRPITLGDLLGRVLVVNFFYTECPDTCPLQSAHMARLQSELADELDLRLVSITVDPEHDTPEVLAEYAAQYRADPERWLFLTGPKDVIYRLAIEGFRLGVVDQDEEAQPGTGPGRAWLGPPAAWAHPVPNPERRLIHSSRFVLVDRQAQIRGYYQGTDWSALERLGSNLRLLLREN